MIEQAIEIPMADGASEGYFFRPDGDSDVSRWPGVIHLTDIGGIRDANRGMAARIAALGYVVLQPNVFYRGGRLPLFEFPRKSGEERTMKRMRELMAPLTPEAMDRDASAYVDFL